MNPAPYRVDYLLRIPLLDKEDVKDVLKMSIIESEGAEGAAAVEVQWQVRLAPGQLVPARARESCVCIVRTDQQ